MSNVLWWAGEEDGVYKKALLLSQHLVSLGYGGDIGFRKGVLFVWVETNQWGKSPLLSFLLQCCAHPLVNAHQRGLLWVSLWVWLAGSPGVTKRIFHSRCLGQSICQAPQRSLEHPHLPSLRFWSYRCYPIKWDSKLLLLNRDFDMNSVVAGSMIVTRMDFIFLILMFLICTWMKAWVGSCLTLLIIRKKAQWNDSGQKTLKCGGQVTGWRMPKSQWSHVSCQLNASVSVGVLLILF